MGSRGVGAFLGGGQQRQFPAGTSSSARPFRAAQGAKRASQQQVSSQRSGGKAHANAQHQHPRNARFSRHVVHAKGGSSGVAAVSVQPGCLVDYEREDRQHVLALVQGANGKKNFWLVDQRGHRTSVAPKDISWVLPGSAYTAADLDKFLAAAAADSDMSLLEIAWAVASDEPGKSYSLAEMAQLLFEDTAPLCQYTTYHMLLQDAVYFKQAKGSLVFEPRTPKAVEAAQQAAAAAAAKRQAQAAWVEAAQAALAADRPTKPSTEAWLSGPHAERVAALKAMATKVVYPKSTEELARESFGLLGLKPAGPDLQHLAEVAWQLLVELGAEQLHAPLALLRAGVSRSFPGSVENEAEALMSSPPQDPDAHLRRDLTHLVTYTVDDAGTLEVDDAISIEQLPGAGGHKLWVHVADPTRWVAPGSGLDAEARSRTRTLYFPFGAVPMFPPALAEKLFSLTNKEAHNTTTTTTGGSSSSSSSSTGQQQQQAGGSQPSQASSSSSDSSGGCPAISVGAVLSEDGSLCSWEVVPSTITIHAQLTYSEADEDLAQGPSSCRFPELQQLYEAARARKAWRVAQGCIDIDLPEAKAEVPEEDLDSPQPRISLHKVSQWESAARMMVAEMMILAGEAVGALGEAQRLPLPYRGQGDPQLPEPEALEALPEGPCRGYALRRCMTRSSIEPAPLRHASLALPAYVQFTSPIRRYADLIAHWNIKAWLHGKPPPFSAADIARIAAAGAETGRELGRAEGEVCKYWAAEYLRQNREQEWAATVLGAFRAEHNLVAVSLEELGLETIVKVDLPVYPGERLSLRLLDVHVTTGYYRMGSTGMLDSPVSQARAAAALAEMMSSEQEQEREQAEEASSIAAAEAEALEAAAGRISLLEAGEQPAGAAGAVAAVAAGLALGLQAAAAAMGPAAVAAAVTVP